MNPTPATASGRWAGLAGLEHGDREATGRPFVFLHGLTFDHRMWEPALELLPRNHRALAFDLPGHGESAQLAEPGLAPVVEAVHEAVLEADLGQPIVVGHSIGGPLAAIYASTYPAAAAVSIEAPVRVEPFAGLLDSIRSRLTAEGFDDVWTFFRRDMQADAVPAQYRKLLSAGDRASLEVFLSYQADLLERPLDEIVRWRESGLDELHRRRVPFVSLHSNHVEQDDRDWLADRLPQTEIVVWPVGHHFPHLAHPARLAALLTGLAAGTATA